MNQLVSKILTFLSGCAATVAAVGTGLNSGIPRWLTIACIVATGGFAKASIGVIPIKPDVK
jgi:hypothetical protein